MQQGHQKVSIDEDALEELLKIQDYPRLASILEDIAKYDLGKTQLWKFRRFYYMLPNEEIEKSLSLYTALAILAVLSGDIEKSNKYYDQLENKAKRLKKNSKLYKNIQGHLCYLSVAMPHKSQKNILMALKSVLRTMKIGVQIPRLSITVNRPSIINGGRDFTRYGRHLKLMRMPLIAMANVLYGEHGTGMPDVAIAETMYQRNEILDSLILLVATIPFIEQKGDIHTLFAAVFIQTCILFMSGQSPSTKTMLDELKLKILAAKADYLLPNLNAIYAWGALYDSDYERINKWLSEEAPNELGEFCTLDRFQYFVKLRVYFMLGKHIALIGLAERLKPILLSFNRKMEQCELGLILSLTYFEQGEREKAFVLMAEALALAEKYRYDRLIGDEGAKMYLLLREYVKERGENPYLTQVMEIARKIGLLYPDYLKSRKEQLPTLTPTELDVLRLMAAERTNTEIAQYMNITIRTVKFHSSNIFTKLSVENRQQAVKAAKKVGVL